MNSAKKRVYLLRITHISIEGGETMYHVAIFDVYDISATHELFQYFDRLTAGAKCMYNVANFYIR